MQPVLEAALTLRNFMTIHFIVHSSGILWLSALDSVYHSGAGFSDCCDRVGEDAEPRSPASITRANGGQINSVT